jgi:hypothetical protein
MATGDPSRGVALPDDARSRAGAPRHPTREVPLRSDLTLVPDMRGTRRRTDRLPAHHAEGNITGNHAKDHT